MRVIRKLRPESNKDCAGKPNQPAWGAWVVIAGLVAITAVFALAVFRFHKASEVSMAVGAVSGVIAAVVGAYFGIRGATLAQGMAQQGHAPQRPAQPPTGGGEGTHRGPGVPGGGGAA